MNRTLKFLMLSDIFVLTGFGLIDPILAIFIKENLVGGTIFAAGLASTVFLVTKSIIQLPFSKYVDSHDEKVKWLFLGSLLISSVPFIYIMANNIKMVYIAQVVHGLGVGLAYPTWLGLWSTNLDKKQESFEWSVYMTLTGLGAALTAAGGAAIAQYAGFKTTFLFGGILSLFGLVVLFFLESKKEVIAKIDITHYHKRRKLDPRRHDI